MITSTMQPILACTESATDRRGRNRMDLDSSRSSSISAPGFACVYWIDLASCLLFQLHNVGGMILNENGRPMSGASLTGVLNLIQPHSLPNGVQGYCA